MGNDECGEGDQVYDEREMIVTRKKRGQTDRETSDGGTAENKRCAEAKKEGSEEGWIWEKARGPKERVIGFSCGSPFWLSLLVFWHMMLARDTGAAKASVRVCLCVCARGSRFCHICTDGLHLCPSVPFLMLCLSLSSFCIPLSAEFLC